jgi:hypothetical protein
MRNPAIHGLDERRFCLGIVAVAVPADETHATKAERRDALPRLAQWSLLHVFALLNSIEP